VSSPTLRPCCHTDSKGAGKAPRQPAPPPLAPDGTREPDPELAALAGEAGSVADGVAGIAGGLEALLSRLRVRATHVTLRVELPPLPPPAAGVSDPESAPVSGGVAAPGRATASEPGGTPWTRSVAVLRLAELRFAGALRPGDASSGAQPAAKTNVSSESAKAHAEPPAAAGEAVEKLYKSVEFAGLTVELYQDGDEAQDAARAAADAAQQRLGRSCVVDAAGDADLEPGLPGDAHGMQSADDQGPTDGSEHQDELGYVVICSPDGVGCAAVPDAGAGQTCCRAAL